MFIGLGMPITRGSGSAAVAENLWPQPTFAADTGLDPHGGAGAPVLADNKITFLGSESGPVGWYMEDLLQAGNYNYRITRTNESGTDLVLGRITPPGTEPSDLVGGTVSGSGDSTGSFTLAANSHVGIFDNADRAAGAEVTYFEITAA